MNKVEKDPVFIRLYDVLKLEREYLQTGRAAEAASLIEEKMLALQDFETLLGATDVPNAPLQNRRAIQTIIQMAQENAAHLEATRNGIRSAITRLEGIAASAHVGSYRQGGAQISFTNATGAFNRKA